MAVEFKDYYATLGVPRTAAEDEIKKAFRKLARQHHPDVAKDKKTAEAKFKEINEAYEVLGNPDNRRKYDQLGADWKQGAPFRPPPGAGARGHRPPPGFEEREFSFGGTGFSDFFEALFGGRARGGGFGGFEFEAGPGGPGRRGHDIEGDLLVSLHEALHGSVRTVTLRGGDGAEQDFKVRIPAGVRAGQLIRVPGLGGRGPGGAGDLYLRVRLEQHPDFRVQGEDLHADVELAPWEAALGATISVPTLAGAVSVRVPPGTSSGRQLRVRGQGLPAGDGARGDLYVTVGIAVPPAAGDAERRLWEELARVSGFQPRAA
jgi:curved DNA-binding protein